ncbi:hypothetical protein MMC17_006733 [Xylographa soralifera]|nr:hypothetical protein [Xylographa soralifera]
MSTSSLSDDSTIDFIIGREMHLFTLHGALLLERAPFLLSHIGGLQVVHLETEDILTFNAFKNWLYNNYTRGLSHNEEQSEPGGPGALWSFAVRWIIVELQNQCMDRITYGYFMARIQIKCNAALVNHLDEIDQHGKMRKFLVMLFVHYFRARHMTQASWPNFTLNFALEREIMRYWNATFTPAYTPYVYNYLDFLV